MLREVLLEVGLDNEPSFVDPYPELVHANDLVASFEELFGPSLAEGGGHTASIGKGAPAESAVDIAIDLLGARCDSAPGLTPSTVFVYG